MAWLKVRTVKWKQGAERKATYVHEHKLEVLVKEVEELGKLRCLAWSKWMSFVGFGNTGTGVDLG